MVGSDGSALERSRREAATARKAFEVRQSLVCCGLVCLVACGGPLSQSAFDTLESQANADNARARTAALHTMGLVPIDTSGAQAEVVASQAVVDACDAEMLRTHCPPDTHDTSCAIARSGKAGDPHPPFNPEAQTAVEIRAGDHSASATVNARAADVCAFLIGQPELHVTNADGTTHALVVWPGDAQLARDRSGEVVQYKLSPTTAILEVTVHRSCDRMPRLVWSLPRIQTSVRVARRPLPTRVVDVPYAATSYSVRCTTNLM